MRIVVFGAGAIGSLFGGFLSKEHDVTLVCREAHAAAINGQGLRITGKTEAHAHPQAATSVTGLAPPDYLFLTVKAYDTKDAIGDMAPLVGPGTAIVSLQNGLGNMEALNAAFPDARVIGAVTSQGAILRAPGLVNHTGYSYTFVGGPGAEELADILTSVGIETEASGRINEQIWYKAIVNSIINPLATLLHEKNGIARDRKFERLARHIVKEGVAVANAGGMELDEITALEKVEKVAMETAENVCSMRLDIEKGCRTEIDHMNGAIARYGKEKGIATPANALLAALIRSLEPYR